MSASRSWRVSGGAKEADNYSRLPVGEDRWTILMPNEILLAPKVPWPLIRTSSNDIVPRPRRVVASQILRREALSPRELHHRLGAPARQVLLAVRGVVRVFCWTRRVPENGPRAKMSTAVGGEAPPS